MKDNMLLEIYKFITKLQDEIGEGATVRLSASAHGALEIRVDWWQDNYHIRRMFTEAELERLVDDSLPINSYVYWCKRQYDTYSKPRLMIPIHALVYCVCINPSPAIILGSQDWCLDCNHPRKA